MSDTESIQANDDESADEEDSLLKKPKSGFNHMEQRARVPVW